MEKFRLWRTIGREDRKRLQDLMALFELKLGFICVCVKGGLWGGILMLRITKISVQMGGFTNKICV